MPIVSIIIPVYNVEKYLARCLDSCINQTFSEIELLCVNDGSTDKSLDILKHYQKYDSRIKIINKENGGLSSARNAGIKQAQGKYILFVDSDDYISSIAVESLFENAERNQSDVVIFDYMSGSSDPTVQKTIYKSQFLSKFENQAFNKNTMGFAGYKFTPPTAWSKFYRTDLIKDRINFCEGVIFEDNPFWAEVYLSAERITYEPKALYYYLTGRSGCIMQNRGETVFDVFKVYESIENSFKNHNLYEKYQSEINLLKIMDYINNYFRIETGLKKAFYERILKENIPPEYDKWLNGNYMEVEKNSVNWFKLMHELDYADLEKIEQKEKE